MITAFKNIFSKEAHYLEIDSALNRIKTGKSKERCDEIRKTIDKEQANALKQNLPSILFSGKFGDSRTDDSLMEHSGYIILDFDNVQDVEFKKEELIKKKYIKACWVSPSGNGVKALIKIADGEKHREHFMAIMDVFPDVDKSGINVSRVCYESYDKNILIREVVEPFTKIKKIDRVKEQVAETDNYRIFENILKWLSNKGDAFVSGERNTFIFKLASACCRFGINEEECFSFANMNFLRNDNSFTNNEALRTIKSAYRSSQGQFGTAFFDNEKLVDRITRDEVTIDDSIFDKSIKPKDVIFGVDVKEQAISIYRHGYTSAKTTHVNPLDEFFKWKIGEITLLSGIGNYGKSTYIKYLLLLQVIMDGEKIAIFSPEEFPAHEFYHDFVEVYFGCNCTPSNPNRPTEIQYERIYDYISQHIFFVYPSTISPTPEYVKERFLELIIKNGVSFCIIDPFNQLTNDYNSQGGRSDKYLEFTLSDFHRFALNNNVYFVIIAHPHKMQKQTDGNYPCPDVYDIADGAMWNNKMDNILIYHLPYRQTDPTNTICQHHSKKIRRRKIVGQVGNIEFKYLPYKRRFAFKGEMDSDYIDYVELAIKEKNANSNVQLNFNENIFNNEIEF